MAQVEFTYKGTDYITNFATLSQLRYMLNKEYKDCFFSRKNKRFFGDYKYKWSKKKQELTILRRRDGKESSVVYEPYMTEDKQLELRLKNV